MISVLLPEGSAAPNKPTKSSTTTDLGPTAKPSDGAAQDDDFKSFMARETESQSPEANTSDRQTDSPIPLDLNRSPEPDTQTQTLLTADSVTAASDAPTTSAAELPTAPTLPSDGDTTKTVQLAPHAIADSEATNETHTAPAADTEATNETHTAPAADTTKLVASSEAPSSVATAEAATARRDARARVDVDGGRLPSDGLDPAIKPTRELHEPSTVKLVTVTANEGELQPNASGRQDVLLTETEAQQNTTTVRADHVDAPRVEAIEAPTRLGTDTAAVADKLTTSSLTRDAAAQVLEPSVSVSSAPSTPTVQTSTGLTPIAPSIPVAGPNDITGIILNALKNGIDPQEQLVVQLDPPELGRVLIDFKFDAQGLQQVVITSENPEALKRLRELHFELTEALKQNGLSDKNMSFRQDTDDRSAMAWNPPDRGPTPGVEFKNEDSLTVLTAQSSQPMIQARDRLDLLL